MKRAVALFLAVLGAYAADTPPAQRDLRQVLGVAHVGGTYNPRNVAGTFLQQGAQEIVDLGSQVIKLWFTAPQRSYPYGTPWPERFSSLVEMARHPNYRAVFDMPFNHYILVAYRPGQPEHYWREGMSEADRKAEQEAFRAFTEYLLTTYRGTGKTFVLQHWEGDWAIRASYKPEETPTPQAIDGMAAWLNARQDGVDAARKAVGADNVHVYHAAEVNLVARAMEEKQPNVVNAVLPKTHLDLVSYSAWDTLRDRERFARALDYIAQHMPDSAAFGAKSVYIGEYGLPENDAGIDAVRDAVTHVTDTAVAWGCPYLIYWQVYCNEAIRKPVEDNGDVRGFWLIKPDGTKAWSWKYLHQKLTEDAEAVSRNKPTTEQ